MRRSSRSASTASPIKDALASPLPASHPIGREEPEAPAPKSTSRVQAAAPPASKKNGSKATSSGVGAFGPLALVVAVLAVGAGVWYSQFYAQPPRKQRREPLASALLEAGIETIPQPVPASPPLPPITAEEAAVFEQVGSLIRTAAGTGAAEGHACAARSRQADTQRPAAQPLLHHFTASSSLPKQTPTGGRRALWHEPWNAAGARCGAGAAQ